MQYVPILCVALVNGFILFYASLFAVGGGIEVIRTIWFFGYSWIAVTTVAAIALHSRGRGSLGVKIVAGALPVAYMALLAFQLVLSSFHYFQPNTAEFQQACQTAGSRYHAKSLHPVESIAYDWEPDAHPPEINHFNIDSNGRATDIGSRLPLLRYPASVKFSESRCCQFSGPPTNRVGPYIRHTRSDYYGITELTADVLVTYKTTRVPQVSSKSPLSQVDIEVRSRRDAKILATHRYFIDRQSHRGCGETSSGVMDETSFVLKALGFE